MKRHYIRATGSTCYDETGITFPVKEAVDWNALLEGLSDPQPTWENEFGWDNQPKVLVFSATEEEARLVDERIEQHPSLRMRTLVQVRSWTVRKRVDH